MTLQLVAGPALTCTLYVRHSVSSCHTAAVPDITDPDPSGLQGIAGGFMATTNLKLLFFRANADISCSELLSQRRTWSRKSGTLTTRSMQVRVAVVEHPVAESSTLQRGAT